MSEHEEHRLWEGYLRGELGAAESEHFGRRLLAEPGLAEQLMRFAQDEATLRRWAQARSKAQAIDEVEAGGVRPPRDRVAWRHLAAAAAVLFAVGLGWWMLQAPSMAPRVVRVEKARWDQGAAALDVGRRLASGQVVALSSGRVELNYPDGVRVRLYGPCRFEVETGRTCRLSSGRLSAEVPPEGVGFTVHTDAFDVVDLGTRFGVSIDRRGRAEVHVFKGEVETRTRPDAGPSESQRLTTTQAARFDPRGRLVAWIDPDPKAFDGLVGGAPGVRSTNRTVRWIETAPASLASGAFESNSSVFLLSERRGVVLPHDLKATFDGQRGGTRSRFGNHTVTIPAGTRVDSYLLHFDPSAPPRTRTGEVEFDRPILGIIARGSQLTASDAVLGLAGVAYPGHDRRRGLDDGDHPRQDVVNLAGAPRRLGVHCAEGDGVDQVRVLVQTAD